MTRLKKLLLTLLLSVLALFGTIGVYGVGSNPYSSDLDSSTMNALDNIIDLVERKGQSLSTQSYYNLISALSNRLRYLDYELLSIRNSLGGNNSGGTTTETTCEWGYRGVSPAPPAPARDCRCGETVTVGGGVYECYENTVTVPVTNPNPGYTPPIDPIGNPSANCDPSNIPPGLTEKPIVYQQLNQGSLFGTDTNSHSLIDFSINEYLAVSGIYTPKVNYYRGLIWAPPPSSTNTPWVFTVSLSECPGDFIVPSGNGRCKITASGYQNLNVSTDPNARSDFYCIIEPNKSYYLNIVHDRDPYGDQYPRRCGFEDKSHCSVMFKEVEDDG